MPKPYYPHKTINFLAYIAIPSSLIGAYLKANYDSNVIYLLSISLGILGSAVILYWLKKSEQFWYGILEVLIGVATLIYSVYVYSLKHEWDETTLDELLKRAALVYLMVRGLGNLDEGIKKEFWLQDYLQPYSKKLKEFLLGNRP